MDFSSLRFPMELRETHITSAVASAEAMAALLKRFAEIAVPGKGSPIILAALARLGTTQCPWLDGELRIEISGDASSSKIVVSTTLGGGFREKLFPDTTLRVPLVEFSRAVKLSPKVIEPLEIKETGTRIVLSVTQEVRRTSLPPPMVHIDPTSMMLVVPKLPAPPRAEPAPNVLAAKRRPGDPHGVN